MTGQFDRVPRPAGRVRLLGGAVCVLGVHALDEVTFREAGC